MVLDIASLRVDRLIALFWQNTLELGHDYLHGLPHDVSQRVQTASMRHSDHKSSRALFNGGIDAVFETGNEGFAALQPEALHCVKLAGHEGTPLVGPVQAFVHVNSLFLAGLAELNRFELFANPVAHLTILDVHELDGYFVAVGITICVD